MSSLSKNLLFALGLSLILWLGYTVFLKDDGAVVSSQKSIASSEATLEAQNFLAKLRRLQEIDLDGSLFNDSSFASLVNFRQDLVEEPTGRENPFAPVSEIVSVEDSE